MHDIFNKIVGIIKNYMVCYIRGHFTINYQHN